MLRGQRYCIEDGLEVEGVSLPFALELLEPMGSLVLHERVCDDFDDLCAVRDASRVCRESHVLNKFGTSQDCHS